MNANPSQPPAPRLDPVLRRLRHRIRGVIATRGALITAVTLLAGLLALVAIDWAFAPLPAAVRWLCPFVWLAAVTAAAIVWLGRPLRKPLELVRIARWLEIRHPELDERVSTVLEVSGHDGSGMSSVLLDELAREAAIHLVQIDPQLEVSTRRARHWLWPAAVLLAVWAVLFAVWPNLTARHVVRALVPTSTLGTSAGRLIVTPGSIEVLEGDPLTITARHTAATRKPLDLVLFLTDGTTSVLPMEARDNGSIYQLGRAEHGFHYEVRAGRETSDRYEVTVWPQPRLTEPRLRSEFPAYTNRASREQALGDGVVALTGTQLELRAKLNTPVDAVRLEIDGQAAGATALQRAADGGTFATRWTLDKPGRGSARVMLKHRLGREFEAARFTIETRPDTPPEVKWLAATDKELHLRPDDLLETGFEISDDVGLSAVQLEVQPANGEAGRLPLDTPPRTGTAEPPAWRGRLHQAVGALVSRWPQSRVFKLRVRAEDSRPADLGGPGVGTSEWLTISLDEGAPSLARQEVAAAHSDARETIEQARQAVQQAREKIERRRPELQADKTPEAAAKELTQARDQLAQAQEKLEKLAERLPETVHAAKTPEMKQAAATVEEARQQLENAPLQDTAKQRDETAAAARDTATKAEQQLEKLRDEIQRSEPQVQEFARLKELEQQQNEIARQAEQALTQNQPDAAQPAKPSDAWQQKQNSVAEALRQTAQQQPQAQAAALEQQAQQASQLANEAKQEAAAQETLKQAAEAAKTAAASPNTPPDTNAAKQALHEQLAKEQAAIASETQQQLAEARQRQDNPTANALPEAVESAKQASDALAQQNDQTAAAEAKDAANHLAEAAKAAAGKPENQESSNSSNSPTSPTSPNSPNSPSAESKQAAADLTDLAARQEQVAEALAALESGKPAEAAADLAAMHAEKAAELAEAIREFPQVNGPSGPMQQAAQSSQQAAAQAKQAAQSDSQGKPAEAAGNHAQASQQLQQAAAQLAQAASEFAQQAAQAAGRQPSPQQAPVPGQPLAEAFEKASQAASSDTKAEAASESKAAAQALAQANAGTLRAMQGKPGQSNKPGESNKPNEPTQPGNNPNESFRNPGADPGVPPELAKLGVSAEDWEKIKASLKSEVGGAGLIALPEEYRDLVRRYFEQISKASQP